LFRHLLRRHVAVGATGDAMSVNSSLVDRTVSEGDHRASWFATARQLPGPRADTDANSVSFVSSFGFPSTERCRLSRAQRAAAPGGC